MILISGEEFVQVAQESGLVLEGELKEYLRVVTTGKRAVMRGVLKKT